MPELPELEVIKNRLNNKLRHKVIHRMSVNKPYVLKNVFEASLRGECIESIKRKGKYLIFLLREHQIIVHLMFRGKVVVLNSPDSIKKSCALFIQFVDKTVLEFSEQGVKKKMSIYVMPMHAVHPALERIGIDPLSPCFTYEALRKIVRTETCHLKSLLRRQKRIAGIGNAYADEILWKARLSPFASTGRLDDKECAALYSAIQGVLQNAIETLTAQGISEKRTFLCVHGREGKPCPRCHSLVRAVSYRESETFYCPQCQTRGRVLKDRRLSRFYR